MVIMTTILAGVVLSTVRAGQIPYQSTDTTPAVAYTDPTLAQSRQGNRGNTDEQSQKIPSPDVTLPMRRGAEQWTRTVGGTLWQSQLWNSQQVYMLKAQVIIPRGVTLIIDAGTLVEAQNAVTTAFAVQEGGSLIIRGASNNYVSIVGASSVTAGSVAVQVSGGTFTANGTHIAGFERAVQLTAAGGATEIEGSNLEGSIVAPYPISVHDTTLQPQGGYSYAVDLRNNSDVSGFALGGPHANILTGEASRRVVAVGSAEIPQGREWLIDSSSRAVLYSEGGLVVAGSLTMKGGTFLKATQSYALIAREGSQVILAGDAENPVYISSFRDDTLAGDSNDDGLSQGGDGDYVSAWYEAAGAKIQAQHVRIQYAQSCASQAADNTESSLADVSCHAAPEAAASSTTSNL